MRATIMNHTSTRTPSRPRHAPREMWTARQCAAYCRISVTGWHARVRKGLAPSHARVRPSGIKVWDAIHVINGTDIPQQPDEWNARDCARHHGVPRTTWYSRVKTGRAPAPIRYVHKRPLWSADEVRTFTRPDPVDTP